MSESDRLTAEQVRTAIFNGSSYASYDGTQYYANGINMQAIADELNTLLGGDDEYEAKMDALLCRLTNGKWSKSRAYDLDFMVSCVDEEYETLYAKELAELENELREAEMRISLLQEQLKIANETKFSVCVDCGTPLSGELRCRLCFDKRQDERTAALESLVREMFDTMHGCTEYRDCEWCEEHGCECVFVVDVFEERMKALGIEEES